MESPDAQTIRRLEEELKKYKATEEKDYQRILDKDTEISAKDDEIKRLNSRIGDLVKEKRTWDFPYQEALAGTKIALDDQQAKFNKEIADWKHQYQSLETHLSQTNKARDADRITIDKQNADLATLGE